MIGRNNILSIREDSYSKILKIKMFEFYDLIKESYYPKRRSLYFVYGYQIMSPYGWIQIDFVRMDNPKNPEDVYLIKTTNCSAMCDERQSFLLNNSQRRQLRNLNIGDMITTEYGLEPITEITYTGDDEVMYDMKVRTPRGFVFIGSILFVG